MSIHLCSGTSCMGLEGTGARARKTAATTGAAAVLRLQFAISDMTTRAFIFVSFAISDRVSEAEASAAPRQKLPAQHVPGARVCTNAHHYVGNDARRYSRTGLCQKHWSQDGHSCGSRCSGPTKSRSRSVPDLAPVSGLLGR